MEPMLIQKALLTSLVMILLNLITKQLMLIKTKTPKPLATLVVESLLVKKEKGVIQKTLKK